MGYPRQLAKFNISESDIREASHKRDPQSNKYSNGRVLIIGGSSSYYGAPVLALDSAYQSLAALRVGTGYVKAFVPSSILQTARSLSPNTIIQGLGDDHIIFNDEVKAEVEKSDVILIGMGMGAKSAAAAKKIIEYALSKSKMVIADADAIEALKDIKIKKQGSVLITPHDGEFQKFCGIKLSTESVMDRAEAAVKVAKEHNLSIVLKGHYTIVTDGNKIKINEAQSATLATMGTGDVLSGIIAGYAAIGDDIFKAAVAGVYLHSKIGDMLYEENGNHIIATDVIGKIPQILKKYDKN